MTDNKIQPLETIYAKRFNEQEEFVRAVTWEVLCRKFFQKFVPAESIIVDLAAGEGLFIKNIRGKERIAIDLDPSVLKLEQYGVTAVLASALDLTKVLKKKVDIIFISNFLEHLTSKQAVLDLLGQCAECLSERGRIIILQPNIRAIGSAYWDYIDHHIALTDQSLLEALDVTGFVPTYFLQRFLPYTAKSGLGHFVGRKTAKIFINLYLKIPLAWRFLGGQCFVVARKTQASSK